MTVSESIINWLMEFDQEEYWKMKKIDTDMQGAKVDEYSLAREPIQNVKAYISGKKIYTDHYTFQARLANTTDADRIDNNGFGEALEGWVREKDMRGEFPVLEGGKVRSIDITTPFYAGRASDNSFVYQMTIAIKYEKER